MVLRQRGVEGEKITPDKWEFTFDVDKRRSGKAPEGSGVPVGTEYHWYPNTSNVRKLDANNYTTSMTGLKFELAHKRAEKDKWSVSENAQRKQLIQVLRESNNQQERQMVEAAK